MKKLKLEGFLEPVVESIYDMMWMLGRVDHEVLEINSVNNPIAQQHAQWTMLFSKSFNHPMSCIELKPLQGRITLLLLIITSIIPWIM